MQVLELLVGVGAAFGPRTGGHLGPGWSYRPQADGCGVT
jgi:hypothetical protein